MKKFILIYIIGLIIILGITYGISCFITLEPNLLKWDKESREGISFLVISIKILWIPLSYLIHLNAKDI